MISYVHSMSVERRINSIRFIASATENEAPSLLKFCVGKWKKCQVPPTISDDGVSDIELEYADVHMEYFADSSVHLVQ